MPFIGLIYKFYHHCPPGPGSSDFGVHSALQWILINCRGHIHLNYVLGYFLMKCVEKKTGNTKHEVQKKNNQERSFLLKRPIDARSAYFPSPPETWPSCAWMVPETKPIDIWTQKATWVHRLWTECSVHLVSCRGFNINIRTALRNAAPLSTNKKERRRWIWRREK